MAKKTNDTGMSGVRERTHERVDKVMDKAESIRDSGREAVANIKEKAVMMKKNADGYVRKNPERSVLIAAGVGAVAGAVIATAVARKKQ